MEGNYHQQLFVRIIRLRYDLESSFIRWRFLPQLSSLQECYEILTTKFVPT